MIRVLDARNFWSIYWVWSPLVEFCGKSYWWHWWMQDSKNYGRPLKNFAVDEYNYRKRQLLRGLWKGRDELWKMTSCHYLKPPIILVLLTHHEHGAPFLRVVLSVLYSSQDTVDKPLIHNPDSSKWGRFIYKDNIDWQKTWPMDEVKWFNVVSNFLVILCIGGDSLVSIASVV